MNQNQAMVVLNSIADLYPKFNLTRRKQQFLIPILIRMDYQGVMNNLAEYVANNPFPPTIAEIAAYPPEPKHQFNLMEKWQEEANKVPEEVKQKFREQFAMLVKEKID